MNSNPKNAAGAKPKPQQRQQEPPAEPAHAQTDDLDGGQGFDNGPTVHRPPADS